MELTRDRVALLAIDLQNAFCHPDASFGQAGVDVSACTAAVPGCLTLVDAAHAAGVPVIYTQAIHEPGLAEWNILAELPPLAPLRERDACLDGSWDAALVDEVVVAPGDLVLTKSRYSPFYENDLAEHLAALGVIDLVVCGVTTSCCVESTVRDASQRSLRPHVPADAVGDMTAAAHTASLAAIGAMFGWTTTCADVARAWSIDD